MIPVLDWNKFQTDKPGFARDLGQACRHTGFFVLKNHPVPSDLIESVFRQGDAFFALPTPEKAKVSVLNSPHFRGWGQAGEERLDETSDLVDSKETFSIGYEFAADDPRVLAGEPFRGPNQWPDVPGFSETLLAYYDAALSFGLEIHRAIAIDLGLPEDYFVAKFVEPLAALRLLSYPPASGAATEIGAGAHSDYGSITLLLSDGEPGLQVRPRGADWMNVPKTDSAYIVNIGDCLMRWTNDIYVSTPHRVLAPTRRRRSVAMFIDADPDAIVEALPGTGAPKYPPIRAADYLMSRLDATYSPGT
ncbi:MAG: 2-oxoglutarate and iron-dependent oxygenase domain-containing protein [Pseudomonadota bacterium]